MDYQDDEPTKYRKFRMEQPDGWTWKETGARGPSWYPPVAEAVVDAAAEHLALCPVNDAREPGAPVALAGAADGDALVFSVLERSESTMEGIVRLNDASFDEVGVAPCFDLAYDFAKTTANQRYLNPMWVYREGS